MLGDELVETIAQLSDTPSTSAQLRQVARVLYADNNPVAVKDARVRSHLIDGLPLGKARELCERLNVPQKGDIYSSLKRIEVGREAGREEALLSFFGVVEDPVAASARKPSTLEVAPSYGLFEYQRDVVLRVLQALREQPHKVLLHMPTGSGKTRTAMHVIARHLLQHGPTVVCWLASSAELLEQAAEEIERSWSALGDRPIEVHRYWGDRSLDLSTLRDGVIVAGFAKMHAAYTRDQNVLIALGDRASLTVVDEAHQAIAPTYRSVAETLYTKQPRNALLGLTATPGRSWDDVERDEELSSYFGRAKVTLAVKDFPDPVSYLISEGYLAQPQFRSLQFDGPVIFSEQDAKSVARGEDVPNRVLQALSRSGQRNYKIVAAIEELMSRHKRVIVFGSSVSHAHLIAGILVARGHEAKVVTGETSMTKREQAIRQFRSGNPRPMVLCNYGVLTTGFDAPNTSAAVIARPTRSLVLYSQMVGRAIRGPRAGGNERAEIVTVVDTDLPGFGGVAEAFINWEDVWNEYE